MKLILLIPMVLATCGATCGRTIPDMPKPPEIVKVVVREYVDVPADLTKDCGNEAVQEQSYAEAKRLAIIRGEYLDECSKRMRKIRALKGTKP